MKEKIKQHKCTIISAVLLLLSNGTWTLTDITESAVRIIQASKSVKYEQTYYDKQGNLLASDYKPERVIDTTKQKAREIK